MITAMALSFAVLAAIDLVGLAAVITAAATFVGATIAGIVALISALRTVKQQAKEQTEEARRQTQGVQELRDLNTKEHEENAERILRIGGQMIERLDGVVDDVTVIKGDISELKGDLRAEAEERRNADETILVLIEDVERKVTGDGQPHFTATVTRLHPTGGE